jgi:hypothetical protein
MSGPQVIEVVVIDSDINDTDEAKGEPDVTVNGKILRMAQGVDGNWYGYFADRDQAQIADSTVTADNYGNGLDFGSFCSADSAESVLGVDLSDTDGVAIANATRADNDDEDGSATGGEITSTCFGSNTGAGGLNAATIENNVVREAKDLSAQNNGQISVNATTGGADDWPFIQLYELNPTGNVVVQYNKGGGVQSTTLTFDTVDQYADLSLDRSVYPRSSQVHVTITDLWLNIDPTDEDSWTFATNADNNTNTFYGIFDENGQRGGTQTSGTAVPMNSTLSELMCEDNCILALDLDAQSSGTNVVTIQDNDDTIIVNLNGTTPASRTGTFSVNNATNFGVQTETRYLGEGSQPITITEQGPNSGVFGTYDESDSSSLLITSNAKRGTSASVDYNETPQTILVGFDFASIDIQPVDDEWSSGEEIPVIIVDGDANKNSRADEDLDLNNPAVTLIPSLKTGDPFTLGEGTNNTRAVFVDTLTSHTENTGAFVFGGVTTNATITVDAFSKIGRMQAGANADANIIVVDFQTTMEDLRNTITDTDDFTGFNFLNLDVRGFNSTGSYDVYIINGTTDIITKATLGGSVAVGSAFGVQIANNVDPQSLTSLDTITVDGETTDNDIFNTTGAPDDNNVGVVIVHSGTTNTVAATDDEVPFVVDFISFGFTDDGVQSSERIAHQIVRIEAEETGDNTSTFEGSLEYVMINQLNIDNINTYSGLTTIADDP